MRLEDVRENGRLSPEGPADEPRLELLADDLGAGKTIMTGRF